MTTHPPKSPQPKLLRKAQKRLLDRRNAHARTLADGSYDGSKRSLRISTGGYKAPGSMKA